tara:strand:+ start:866 stop:1120 length:255 start_codon:yes stop_codon:yes gene_type:complete
MKFNQILLALVILILFLLYHQRHTQYSYLSAMTGGGSSSSSSSMIPQPSMQDMIDQAIESKMAELRQKAQNTVCPQHHTHPEYA